MWCRLFFVHLFSLFARTPSSLVKAAGPGLEAGSERLPGGSACLFGMRGRVGFETLRDLDRTGFWSELLRAGRGGACL